MAAGRLDDSQKQALVQRYRAGEASAALAEAFGCSANTVSRTVKALIPAVEYEALKQHRARGGSGPGAVDAPEVEASADLQQLQEQPQAASLALDDAADFEDDDLDIELEDNDSDAESFAVIAPLVGVGVIDRAGPVQSRLLVADELPESLYLLVDREVELKGTPVKDFSELGNVAPEEEELQAIALFANPRQAKRQCGRSQRVIKLPDPSLLERTAPYILAQGISRIVLEGALYAVPGSKSR
jgi:transposase-like protein